MDSNKKYKIALVDSDVHVVQMLSDLFTDEGFEVVTSTQSLRSFDRVYQSIPDIVVMAVEMPYLDGLDQLKLLHLDGRTKGIPVILMVKSAVKIPKTVPRALTTLRGFIAKPFQIADLLQMVLGVLSGKEYVERDAASDYGTFSREQLVARKQVLILDLTYKPTSEFGDAAEKLGWVEQTGGMVERSAETNLGAVILDPEIYPEVEDFINRSFLKLGTPIIVYTQNPNTWERLYSLGAFSIIRKPNEDRLIKALKAAREYGSSPYRLTKWRSKLHFGRMMGEGALSELAIDGQTIKVSPLEFRLLRELAENSRSAVSASDLIYFGWGHIDASLGSLRGVLSKIRKKLRPFAFEIEVVRKKGYQIIDTES